MSTRTVRSADGTSIAYEQSGSGAALVLVHPAAGFRGFGPMPELRPHLESLFTVFDYDRRGRGESGDTEPYDVAREVEDLRAVVDAAGGSALVFGYSSGAVLALHAALAGLPLTRIALFEPPVHLDGPPPDEPDLGAEVSALVEQGRRGDAVAHFMASIGVPEEMTAGMRDAPSWPALEALAHTLAYDTEVIDTMSATRLADVTTPTLVLSSASSGDELNAWAAGVAASLPNAEHRSLAGEWHGAPPEALAAALGDFLLEG